jgi:hypothetical protein
LRRLPLHLRQTLSELMAFLNFEIAAPRKCFHLRVKDIESLVSTLKPIVYGVMEVAEFSFTKAVPVDFESEGFPRS